MGNVALKTDDMRKLLILLLFAATSASAQILIEPDTSGFTLVERNAPLKSVQIDTTHLRFAVIEPNTSMVEWTYELNDKGYTDETKPQRFYYEYIIDDIRYTITIEFILGKHPSIVRTEEPINY